MQEPPECGARVRVRVRVRVSVRVRPSMRKSVDVHCVVRVRLQT